MKITYTNRKLAIFVPPLENQIRRGEEGNGCCEDLMHDSRSQKVMEEGSGEDYSYWDRRLVSTGL
jgi:hypothetical protein